VVSVQYHHGELVLAAVVLVVLVEMELYHKEVVRMEVRLAMVELELTILLHQMHYKQPHC
jgi:hypothetical protein